MNRNMTRAFVTRAFVTRAFVTRALLGALLLTATTVPAAAADDFPTIIELYTSQGCSACPPADAYLMELVARQMDENFVVLGFHVDIWDYLGWADTFSDPKMTERQRGYMQAMNLRSVYTPQMVIGGRHDVVGADREAVERILAAGPAGDLPAPERVWFELQEDGMYLNVSEGDFDGVADVWLITFGAAREVEILRGENAGAAIVYGNVVEGIEWLGAWTGKHVDFALDQFAYGGADPGVGCVAVVQIAGQGPILAALQIPIRDPAP